jgi:hypothetical protein
MAAVISMSSPVTAGATVQLCLDQKPFGKPGKALASVCDIKSCVVTIPIDEWPKDLAATAVSTRMSAVVAGGQCSPDGSHPVGP